MKFIVKKEHQLYDQISAVMVKMGEVNATAGNMIKEQLGDREWCNMQRRLAGGVAAIQFKEGPPDKTMWKRVGDDYQCLYYPKAANKAMLDKIARLPVMEYEEINNLVNYKAGFVPGTLTHSARPGFHRADDYILIELVEGWAGHYNPVDGMQEILASEYASHLETFKKQEDARQSHEDNNK